MPQRGSSQAVVTHVACESAASEGY